MLFVFYMNSCDGILITPGKQALIEEDPLLYDRNVRLSITFKHFQKYKLQLKLLKTLVRHVKGSYFMKLISQISIGIYLK